MKYARTVRTRNEWQSPAVARQPQRTHPGEDTPLQRSNRRACCLRDVMQWGRSIPFTIAGVFWVHSAFFVPGDLDLWPLTLTFKLLRAKDQTRLPCEFGANPFRGSCHPLSNMSPKKEGVPPISADFAPKIGCHGNLPWPIGKPIPDWTSTPTCLPSLKFWWRSV